MTLEQHKNDPPFLPSNRVIIIKQHPREMAGSRFRARWEVMAILAGAVAGTFLAAAARSDARQAARPVLLEVSRSGPLSSPLPSSAANVAARGVMLTTAIPPVSPSTIPDAHALPPASVPLSTPIISGSSGDLRRQALARELTSLWTRDAESLVGVIDDASHAAAVSPKVTLLLAIAYAETNGKILDVSEAGAVGLSQATPVACQQEHCEGKLYVTADYLTGARNYIMKKPLGDADRIASRVLDDYGDDDTLRHARRLLKSAISLRREGVGDLDLLDPWASPRFYELVREADRHNVAVLEELGGLLREGASRKRLRAYRRKVHDEYRSMLRRQHESWDNYEDDLAGRRDRMLTEHFQQPAAMVKKLRAYEAGEYLAGALDVRFSASKMAAFLVRHLEHKAEEASKLAGEGEDLETVTAALYNGGSHNVKRMRAGLIVSLRETQHYMRKVPAMRRHLDAIIAAIHPAVTPDDAEAIVTPIR